MGCGATSGCKKDDRRKAEKIDYSMDNCNIGEFDSLFGDVRNLLQTLEEARAGLRETVDDIKEMCEIDRLQKPTFEECIRVWMWSISANNGGAILNAGFTVTDSAPFFDVNCNNCTWEAWYINDYFKTFIKTAMEMPEKVVDAVNTLSSLADKASGIDPVGAIESSDLDFFDKAKAVQAFASNAKKTVEGLARAKDVAQIIAEAALQIKALVLNMKQWLGEADVYGKQAFAKACWRPYQIVRDIHPGPKKTPDQLKDLEEQIRENKCGCPKCLKEAQEQALKDVKK